ncbi:MAG: hypothetical protein HYZ71_10830 [Deltaproteobacteria bacterium]|nr:hypothetical protein [Deltaproteobacteria bacterium]
MKRSLAVILTVLAGVSMAKPLSFLDSLQLTPSLKESNAAIVGCTDFSGKWSGNCSGQGQSAKEEFTITQSGCEMIEIASGKGKHTLPVGGVFSVGGAMPGTPAATSFGGSITSNWNKELTVLNFYVHGGMKKLTIDDAGKGGVAMSTAKIDGGRLIIDLKAHSSEGKAEGTCEFTKATN